MLELHNMKMKLSNMRKKSKGTTKCEKRIVTHNIGTAQCEDRTVKCEKKIKEPPNVRKELSNVRMKLSNMRKK